MKELKQRIQNLIIENEIEIERLRFKAQTANALKHELEEYFAREQINLIKNHVEALKSLIQ